MMDMKINTNNSNILTNSALNMGTTTNFSLNSTQNNNESNAKQSMANSVSSNKYSNLHQQINSLNQQLNKSSYKVEFDTNSGGHSTWLNIVDTTTGKVVFKIPPEQIRNMIETQGNNSGIALNRHF